MTLLDTETTIGEEYPCQPTVLRRRSTGRAQPASAEGTGWGRDLTAPAAFQLPWGRDQAVAQHWRDPIRQLRQALPERGLSFAQ